MRKTTGFRKGMALFITLVSLALLSVIGFGLISISSSYSRTVVESEDVQQAYYLAKIGILRAMDKLENESFNWGNINNHPNGISYTMGDENHTYTVKVEDATDASFWLTRWKITSTATCNGATRTLTAYTEMETFAKFAYFTDREQMTSGSIIWFTSGDSIAGKVHSNGYYSINGNPKFSEGVTSSNNSDPWLKNNGKNKFYEFDYEGTVTTTSTQTKTTGSKSPSYYTQKGKKKTKWYTYTYTYTQTKTSVDETNMVQTVSDPKLLYHSDKIQDGAAPIALYDGDGKLLGWQTDYPLKNSELFYFAGIQDEIQLPTETDTIKNNAGIYIDYNNDHSGLTGPPGRIYINNADKVNIEFQNSGNAILTWKDRTTNQNMSTTVSTANQTIYSEVDVYLKGGTMSGKTTINAGRGPKISSPGQQEDKTIYIENDVKYKNSSQDLLGLVANNNIIVQDTAANRDNCEINAILMAINGSFTVQDYRSGSPRGTLTLFGGLIQNKRGPVGTFNQYGTSTGYNKNYNYDAKLKVMSPPNFPTTGRLTLLCIKDESAIND